VTIKNKMIALLLSALLVTGFIVSGSGMYVLYGKTMDNTQLNMNGQASELAGEVTELFSSFSRSGKLYNEDSDLKSGDDSRIQAKINAYFAANWGADHLAFLNSSGIRIAITPYDVKAIGGSIADRKFFKDTMNDQQSHISDALVNRITGVPSVVVTQPIKGEDGKLIGIIGQSVDLVTLQNFLAQIKVGSSGVAAIIAQDGSLLAHTNRDLLKEQRKIPEYLLQSLAKNTGQLISYQDLAGRESLALSVPIKNTEWFALISLPKSEIQSEFYASLISMLISLLISLVVVGFIAWVFLSKLLRPIEMISQQVVKIGDGDLSVKINSSSKDEIGMLARSLSKAIEDFRKIIMKVQEASESVSSSSEELTAGTEQLAQAADQVTTAITDVANGTIKQMQAVDNTMSIVEQMSAGLQQIAANSGNVSAIAQKTANTAREGGIAVQKVTSQMTNIDTSVNNSAQVVAKLGDRSKEIGKIVDTISAIAGQTNLLALNAAIEAARAGEQGRGFAVVADEVRKLAEQSQEAAKEIADLITEIQGDTNKAVIVMDKGKNEAKRGTEVASVAGEFFAEIATLVENVSDQIRDISTAIEQMASGSEQIVSLVKGIALISTTATEETQTVSAATEEQSASIQEIASASTDLSNMAGNLQEIVSKFRI